MRAAALSLALGAPSTGALASTDGHIWTDPYTGFAIGGYDPIAYFAEGRPLEGKQLYQMEWNGVAWRFANPGNLAAFRDHPEIYSPEFGGYGAMSIARGNTGFGNPLIFAVHDGRLYLFYSQAERDIWLKDPKAWIVLAEKNWENLSKTLPE